MLYFAYGSNMFTPRLRFRVQSANPLGAAVLSGYELRWHKLSKRDGSGKCNAHRSRKKSAQVLGVLFEIDDDEKSVLDTYEGLGYGYSERKVTVVSAKRKVKALAYVAETAYVDDSLQPLSWYKSFVVRGAREHKLSKDYVDRLSSQGARRDSDVARDRDERARVLRPARHRQTSTSKQLVSRR